MNFAFLFVHEMKASARCSLLCLVPLITVDVSFLLRANERINACDTLIISELKRFLAAKGIH